MDIEHLRQVGLDGRDGSLACRATHLFDASGRTASVYGVLQFVLSALSVVHGCVCVALPLGEHGSEQRQN